MPVACHGVSLIQTLCIDHWQAAAEKTAAAHALQAQSWKDHRWDYLDALAVIMMRD